MATFSSYGMVETVRLINSKVIPGAFSGRCFVKYDRASSAALAVENLDGAPIDGESQPLKVTYALPKNQPKDALMDAEVPPRSRLFVTYLKTTPEEVHPPAPVCRD